MYSTSGTQSPNFLNHALTSGGGLSMGVVEKAIMNEAQTTADYATSVAPNFINGALPDGGGLSMEVMENFKMNKA